VDNFLLIGTLGVLALYFYSSMSMYKSLYYRISEEKKMAEESIVSSDKVIKKYEAQIHNSIATIKDSQDSLQLAREDLQKIKIANNELEHKNQLLQNRINELYASVGEI
jgi:hypothetical protein